MTRDEHYSSYMNRRMAKAAHLRYGLEWMGLFAGAEMAEEKAWKYSKHNPYKSVRKINNNNLSQICKEK